MKTSQSHRGWMVTRRDWLRATGALMAGLNMPGWRAGAEGPVRFGFVTDCHYADREPLGTRHYRESLTKLSECVTFMNEQNVAFLVEGGDFKDEDTPPNEVKTLEYLRRIEGVFQKFKGPRYHVLGNHDLDSISKTQFQNAVDNTGIENERTYFSFDKDGVHVVVLDACFRNDGAAYDHGDFEWTDSNIPASQLNWLKTDLAKANAPAIVFVHQRLDADGRSYGIKNAPDVRSVLETSGKMLAVFQGHEHVGGHSQIEGIHYYTLKAVVEGSGTENSAFAIAEIDSAGNITVTGYKQAESMALTRGNSA